MESARIGKDALTVWYVTEQLEGMSIQRMYEAVGCITLAIRCGANIPSLHDRLADLYKALGVIQKNSKSRRKEPKPKAYIVHESREANKPRYDDDTHDDDEEEPF